MPIDWMNPHVLGDGICRLEITHSMNGLFDDVRLQELRLLRQINDFFAEQMTCVGLLSYDNQMQPNTKLRRKFGFWDEKHKQISPASFKDQASNFNVAFDVTQGVYFVGGVVVEQNNFESISALAPHVNPALFFWSENKSGFRSYVECLVDRNDVFVLSDDGRSHQISYGLLVDICRDTGSCICIPDLSIDVAEADFIVIDPLKKLGTCCDEFIQGQTG